ncbi:MAG TPA: hypothetical protein VGK16_15250 [Candidatus Limnocylindrales bacterium]|jgi:hypothetical protein
MRPVRILRTLLIGGLLAANSLLASAPGVAAYGKAAQPLAQIEFSANCNNPGFGLCQEVGLGGIWFWVEIDGRNQRGDIAGAGCGHVRGDGGGGGSIRGEISWWWSASPQGLPAVVFAPDPDGYYNFALPGPGGPEYFSFPVTVGHHSAHPAAGVAIEVQVAP